LLGKASAVAALYWRRLYAASLHLCSAVERGSAANATSAASVARAAATGWRPLFGRLFGGAAHKGAAAVAHGGHAHGAGAAATARFPPPPGSAGKRRGGEAAPETRRFTLSPSAMERLLLDWGTPHVYARASVDAAGAEATPDAALRVGAAVDVTDEQLTWKEQNVNAAVALIRAVQRDAPPQALLFDDSACTRPILEPWPGPDRCDPRDLHA
jgi:hypothetical protein